MLPTTPFHMDLAWPPKTCTDLSILAAEFRQVTRGSDASPEHMPESGDHNKRVKRAKETCRPLQTRMSKTSSKISRSLGRKG